MVGSRYLLVDTGVDTAASVCLLPFHDRTAASSFPLYDGEKYECTSVRSSKKPRLTVMLKYHLHLFLHAN